MIYSNVLPNIGYSTNYKTIHISKFDDSLSIPKTASNGQILYQYIINTAKSISNINYVTINITPDSVSRIGGSNMMMNIVEVIYANKISSNSQPIRYEKMCFNPSNGNVYKLQTITELEEITL